jgi:DNA polymerase-3 subunit alpha
MYAKKRWIVVWPWRWSAAWSLLGYLIRITEIDPMEYDLLFERFLNPARVSMPDIDTDFEDSERWKILEYAKEKYGVEKVANIWTYMTMAAKASFKDVARVFGLSFTKSNQLSNYIEKHVKDSYENNEEFKKLVDEDETLKKIVEFSSKLEWTTRQTWVHACGVIIAPEAITNYSPVQYPPKAGSKEPDSSRVVTQYDGHYLEDIWLLKMDFLGLRNLSIIKNTIKILKAKWELEKLPSFYENFFKYSVFEPPIDDEKTYEIFQNWDTIWVFQFESDGMRAWLKKLKPSSIDDIIAMVSLYRPWPMEWIPNYIDRKQGKEKVTYLPKDIYDELVKKYGKEVAEQQKKQIREDLSPFMDVTYWIPVYQEQLMRIVQAMAWFSLGEADLLRRWVGKKIKEVIEKLKIEFIEKAAKFKDYKEEVSRFVYEKMIEPAANYSFNKSHAACYAIIAYQTAYLKAHHPVEFYAALLRSVEENTDRFAELLEELKIKWIKIKPVNVNYSYNHIADVDDAVVVWFLAIKWIWYEVGEHIEQERIKNWPYKDLEDFLTRNEKYINKKTLEALVKSWALDDFEDRLTLYKNIENILDWIKKSQAKQQTAWMWLFGEELLWKDPLKLVKPKEWRVNSLMEKLKLEYEAFWTFISAHPFDGLYKYIKRKYNFSSQVQDENYEWDYKLLAYIKDIVKSPKFWWYFIQVEDLVGSVRFFVKNIPWLKVFDVIEIQWQKKWKRLSISKILKINLEKLIEKLKAKWKYVEEDLVAKVRASRNNSSWSEKIITDNKNLESTNLEDVAQISSSSCEIDCNIENVSNNENLEQQDYSKVEISKADPIEENLETNNTNISAEWNSCISKSPNNLQISYEEVVLELPENIEDLQKLIKMKKENPNQREFKLNEKLYLI